MHLQKFSPESAQSPTRITTLQRVYLVQTQNGGTLEKLSSFFVCG